MGSRIVEEEVIRTWIADAVANGGGGGSSYLVYTALPTQTGTDAPIANVLENTLGSALTWSRVILGRYRSTGYLFDAARTILPAPFNGFLDLGNALIPVYDGGTITGYYSISFSGGGNLQIDTLDPSFTLIEWSALLGDAGYIPIDIKVYP